MQKKDLRRFIYRIDLEDRITFVNDEWLAFGIENGITTLSEEIVIGKSLWDFISDHSIKHLYQSLFNKIREKKNRPKIPYRCDSPDCRRFMQMDLIPFEDGEIQFVNRILKQEFRSPVELLKPSVERSNDFLAICSVCKKVRLRENTWYEIEEAIAILGVTNVGPFPQLTHSMCDGCGEEWKANLGLPE